SGLPAPAPVPRERFSFVVNIQVVAQASGLRLSGNPPGCRLQRAAPTSQRPGKTVANRRFALLAEPLQLKHPFNLPHPPPISRTAAPVSPAPAAPVSAPPSAGSPAPRRT